MRKGLFLVAVLLLCTAWVVAQQDATSTPAGSSGQASSSPTPTTSSQSSAQTPSSSSSSSQTMPSSSSSAGQSTSPSTSSAGAGQSAPPSSSASGAQTPDASAGSNVVEGCLGGAPGNFTVTDSKTGTTYKLDLPQTQGNNSILSQHVGESVQVAGPLSSSQSSTTTNSGAATTASSASQQTIKVAKIGRGTGTCPGSSNSTSKPPSK